MIFFESIKLYFLNTFNVKGRTRRAHYNYALLTFGYLSFGLHFSFLDLDEFKIFASEHPVYLLLLFLLFIPSFTLIIRRMHDIGVNAWAMLFVLIPFLGEFIMINLMWALPYEGRNKWGPNPLDELEKDSDQPEKNAESIWTKKETVNTEKSDENYNNEMEEELQKVEDMYKKKTITSAERKKMRNKILNID